MELFLILLVFGLATLFVPGSNSTLHPAVLLKCFDWLNSLSLSVSLTPLVPLNDTGQNWMRCAHRKLTQADLKSQLLPQKKLVGYFIKYLSTRIYLRLPYVEKRFPYCLGQIPQRCSCILLIGKQNYIILWLGHGVRCLHKQYSGCVCESTLN